jgi:hypothetical protein
MNRFKPIHITIDKPKHCHQCFGVFTTPNFLVSTSLKRRNNHQRIQKAIQINNIKPPMITNIGGQCANAALGIAKRSKQSKIFLKRYILMKNFLFNDFTG